MRNLEELAAQAAIDNRRAEMLRRTIQALGEASSPEDVRFEIELRRNRSAYSEAEEIAGALKRLWPAIWEEAMRAAVAELEQIEKRYAPILQEPSP
ncbi:UNVERIFIED_ORG: hypothetical protein LHK14_17675 [Roseateles sp. XES5]|nr:hypothetical protein [Roseateles sp. XES5]